MNIFFILILYFAFYSFVGWFCETIYCSVAKKKVMNRGFLNGPFCPIYGFGALILILTLSGLKNQVFLLFFSSSIITSVLEYVTSYVMEKVFHAKWWDYSKKKWNLHGRICLKNSLIFGVMSVLFIEFLHPIVSNFVHSLSHFTVSVTAVLLLIYFLIDFSVTVFTILKLNGTLRQLQHFANSGKPLHEILATYQNSVSKMERAKRLSYKRIFHAFPEIKSIRHSHCLEQLKISIKKEKIKKP